MRGRFGPFGGNLAVKDDDSRKKPRRSYRPTVEGLEALRLFSGLLGTPLEIPSEHDWLPESDSEPGTAAPPVPADLDSEAWDAALGATRPSEILKGRDRVSGLEAEADPESLKRGLNQLDRYLAATWARARLPERKHEDSTQAVYLTLLNRLGRPGFDRLVAEIGRSGVRDVLSRETAEGPDFFRAIDAAKKRAQRERAHASIEEGLIDPPQPVRDEDGIAALNEAIERTLSDREAELIRLTIAGESPAEIAERWGVAAKTVSNEKSRAFQKIRDFLLLGESEPDAPDPAAATPR